MVMVRWLACFVAEPKMNQLAHSLMLVLPAEPVLLVMVPPVQLNVALSPETVTMPEPVSVPALLK